MDDKDNKLYEDPACSPLYPDQGRRGRRGALKKIIIGASALTLSPFHLPLKWSSPIVDQITIPAHAQTSPPIRTTPPPTTTTTTTTPPTTTPPIKPNPPPTTTVPPCDDPPPFDMPGIGPFACVLVGRGRVYRAVWVDDTIPTCPKAYSDFNFPASGVGGFEQDARMYTTSKRIQLIANAPSSFSTIMFGYDCDDNALAGSVAPGTHTFQFVSTTGKPWTATFELSLGADNSILLSTMVLSPV